MTFATNETSVDDGQPIELLIVSFLTTSWYYTTAAIEHVHDGNIYFPLPITRGEVRTTGDVAKSALTIKVPQDCPIGDLFRIQPPSGIVSVTMLTKHIGDVDAKVFWKGRIVNSEWEFPWLSFTTENVFSSLQRLGLRRKFSVQCPHALYGVGEGLCNVDRETYRRDYVVTSISGATVTCSTATEKASGYFAGGFITWIHNVSGQLERRMVTEFSGAGGLTLSSPSPGLTVGQTLSAYPGCDHSLAVCESRFTNSLNFGGTPFIPTKNPFGGSTVY